MMRLTVFLGFSVKCSLPLVLHTVRYMYIDACTLHLFGYSLTLYYTIDSNVVDEGSGLVIIRQQPLQHLHANDLIGIVEPVRAITVNGIRYVYTTW